MKRAPFHAPLWWEIKHRLADWLSRCACYLRGETWYVADTWHGVPGNRAAELRQRIWLNVVLISDREGHDKYVIDEMERDLAELAQAAGEAWGHVWPKEAAR